jgi:hypothetical protein
MRAVAAAVIVFCITFSIVAVPLFFLAIVLAGPHSDVLPNVVQPVVLLAAWLLLIGIPIWAARRGYQWQVRRSR